MRNNVIKVPYQYFQPLEVLVYDFNSTTSRKEEDKIYKIMKMRKQELERRRLRICFDDDGYAEIRNATQNQ